MLEQRNLPMVGQKPGEPRLVVGGVMHGQVESNDSMIITISVLMKPIDWRAEEGKDSTFVQKQKYVANRVLIGERIYRTWRLADHSPEEHVAVTLIALIDSDPKMNEQALEA